jgi:O-antigen ligase
MATIQAWTGAARNTAAWAGGAVAAAGAAGALAAVDVRMAVAFVAAAGLTVAWLWRPSTLLALLLVAFFAETLTFGGLSITVLVAPVAVLAVVLASLRGAAALRWAPPLGWAVAYALWALASVLWTESTPGTVERLTSLAIGLVYLLAFASLVRGRDDLDRVFGMLAVGATAVGLLGIVSFAGAPGEGRAEGLTGDPNFFAALQLVALPPVLALALSSSARRRVLLYVAAVVIVVSVVATLSRGGVSALGAVVALLLALPARGFFRSRRQKVVVAVGVALLAATAAATVGAELASRFSGSESGTEGGSGRYILWAAARTAVEERPLVGIGYGAFGPRSNELVLRTPGVSLQHFELQPNGREVHNTYLSSLAELGALGLVLLLGLLASSLRLLIRTARAARTAGDFVTARAAYALMLSLTAWAVTSATLTADTARTLWLTIGLAVALPRLVTARAD